MSDYQKIGYYDLKHEHRNNRLPAAMGRQQETARLSRVLQRRLQHHAIVSAPSGSGKTALVFAWAKQAATDVAFQGKNIALLETATLQKIGQLRPEHLPYFSSGFESVENCVLIIDSFGEMIFQSPQALQNWNLLLKPLFTRSDISLILTMQPEELEWLRANKSHFLSHFEIINLETLPSDDVLAILRHNAQGSYPGIRFTDDALEAIANLTKRFPALGQRPRSALQLLDEAALHHSPPEANRMQGAAAPKNNSKIITAEVVEKIAAEKTGIPLTQLASDEKELIRNLGTHLNKKIIGQQQPLNKMVSVIQRAKLGLRSPNRPLGSFLVLGPSGVGKTETAKLLAQTLYGSDKNFLRVDMSEFGETHAVARLVGSPAGYVGFDDGGQLTNHFLRYPYSLLLLDEIEKAHSKIFDIFLQLLDDGRLTSAKGETVDFTQSIVMATSNMAVDDILEAHRQNIDLNSPEFIQGRIIPKLMKTLRPEFLNRFDAVLIYQPLEPDHLVDIALLEIAKLEERMKKHQVKFSVSRQVLAEKVLPLCDPRFGARPVKRFIESTCEELISQKLLS